MPAIDYVYNPLGDDPNNLIENEVQAVDITVDRAVFPQHGAFFATSLIITGTEVGGSTRLLEPNLDYFLSPLFVQGSAATGKEIVSYFVLLKEFTSVTYTYRVLGQYTDSIVLAQVANASFDRSTIEGWYSVLGDTTYFNPNVNNPGITQQGVIETISIHLQNIADRINNPFSTSNVSRNEITDLQALIGNIANIDEIANQHKNPTVEVEAENVNGETITIHTYPKTTGTYRAVISFDTGDKVHVADVLITSADGEIRLTTYGESTTHGQLFSLLLVEGLTDISVRATTTEAGTFALKTLFEH